MMGGGTGGRGGSNFTCKNGIGKRDCAATEEPISDESETELYTVLYTNAQSVLNNVNELCVVARFYLNL